MAIHQGRWTPEAAAILAIIVMAPWDVSKPFLPEVASFAARNGREYFEIADEMGRGPYTPQRFEAWSRRLGILPADASGIPAKLPLLKLRPGRRRAFTSGEILERIRRSWGTRPSKPVLLHGLAICPYVSRVGHGGRPRYRLNRVPRTRDEWIRAAGPPRFVRLGSRWFELGRIRQGWRRFLAAGVPIG